MTWQDLLNNSRARKHTTSKSELDGLRAVVARDLADAAVPQLSADRRFATAYTAYFDTCRRKRNQVDYDVAGIISETEAEELVEKVTEFYDEVERWIAANHPTLVP